VGRLVGRTEIDSCVVISDDLAKHTARIAQIAGLGVDTIHLHCVGRNQERFIDIFGSRVLPDLRQTQLT